MRDIGDGSTAARDALREALPVAREAAAIDAVRVEAHADVVVCGNLGEILLHLGELDEGERWLHHADGRARQAGLVSLHRRNGVNLGEALLARGQPDAALALLSSRMGTAVAAADEPVTRLRLHHAMYRACDALGQPARALEHLKSYLAIERRRAVQQLQAQSRLLVSRREAEQARQDLQHQQRRAADLEREAQRDPLTGLINRREADRRLPALLARSAAGGVPLAFAMLDLDRFKQVNDAFGHPTGDAVLRRFADVVSAHLRGDDLLVRWGGEEFLLVLTDAAPDAALEVVERLRRAVQGEPWGLIAPGLAVTVSVGLASGSGPGPELLVRRADDALYRAKALGRNRVVVA
jgi:diguanylate cyclase (GGDEF)-like protein